MISALPDLGDYDEQRQRAEALIEYLADNEPMTVAFPISTMLPFAGDSTALDPGWLLCDGSAISRATYAALFAAIGETYGAGDGTTTFNLPDPRGRTLVAAGMASVIGETAYSAGTIDGRERVTLDITNVPPHSHSLVANAGGSGPQAQWNVTQGNSTPFTPFSIKTFNAGGNPVTGLAEPLPIMQPSLVVDAYIIYAGV